MNIQPKNHIENSYNQFHQDPIQRAVKMVQSLALKELTAEHIVKWNSVLSNIKDQESVALKLTLDPFVNEVNTELCALKKHRSERKLADVIGKCVCQFENIHPFSANNSQIAQLIAGYMTLNYGIPMIRFKEGEQIAYSNNVKNPEKMADLIAEKMRETVYDSLGNECYLQENYQNAGRYYCPTTGMFSTVEWHHLKRS